MRSNSRNWINTHWRKGRVWRGHGVAELPVFTAALMVLRDHSANTYLPAHEWIGRLLISECNRIVCFWCCHCNRYSYSNSNWQTKEIWVRAKGRWWSQDGWVEDWNSLKKHYVTEECMRRSVFKGPRLGTEKEGILDLIWLSGRLMEELLSLSASSCFLTWLLTTTFVA